LLKQFRSRAILGSRIDSRDAGGGSSYCTNAVDPPQDRYQDCITRDLTDLKPKFAAALFPSSASGSHHFNSILGGGGSETRRQNDAFVEARSANSEIVPYGFPHLGRAVGSSCRQIAYSRPCLPEGHLRYQFLPCAEASIGINGMRGFRPNLPARCNPVRRGSEPSEPQGPVGRPRGRVPHQSW
jgi:hypothetical protein